VVPVGDSHRYVSQGRVALYADYVFSTILGHREDIVP
jgi:hypothetical protein